MKINFRRFAGALALAAGLAIGAGSALAQGPDYSKNKTYQQGIREGKVDKVNNKDHSKKHHFKKDEDQKAYEAGYQEGRNK
jgi:hypothetical protein